MTARASTVRSRPIVAVAGGGGELDRATAEAARALGAAIARAGAHLLCGGLGGAMNQAARGFHEAGGAGLVIGVLPGEDRSAANPYVDLALATGLGRGRNAVVALGGDGLVAVGGAGGTLSEVGLALQTGRRVAVLPATGGAAGRMAGFVAAPGESAGRGAVYAARDAEDAVEYALGRR